MRKRQHVMIVKGAGGCRFHFKENVLSQCFYGAQYDIAAFLCVFDDKISMDST